MLLFVCYCSNNNNSNNSCCCCCCWCYFLDLFMLCAVVQCHLVVVKCNGFVSSSSRDSQMIFVCNFNFNIAHSDLLSYHTCQPSSQPLHNTNRVESMQQFLRMSSGCILVGWLSKQKYCLHVFIRKRHEKSRPSLPPSLSLSSSLFKKQHLKIKQI